MFIKSFRFATLAFLYALYVGAAFGAPIQTGASTDPQIEATNSTMGSDPLDSTSHWVTQGTGSCATGALTCAASGRQIGCSATGEYVKCQYTAGDVGWVRCDARGNGSASRFEDSCP